MSKFLKYRHDSGEIVFVRKDKVCSFHPKYVHTRGYVVYVTDGVKEFPVHKCENLAEAELWVEEQIAEIEGCEVEAEIEDLGDEPEEFESIRKKEDVGGKKSEQTV